MRQGEAEAFLHGFSSYLRKRKAMLVNGQYINGMNSVAMFCDSYDRTDHMATKL